MMMVIIIFIGYDDDDVDDDDFDYCYSHSNIAIFQFFFLCFSFPPFQKTDPLLRKSDMKKDSKKKEHIGFESKLGENINFLDDFSELSEVCFINFFQ